MSDQDDIKIQTESADNGEIDEISVKTFIETAEQEWLERSVRFLVNGEFNERMIAGEQFNAVVNNEIIDDDYSDESRSSRNHLSNLALTWTSRVLEERPSIQCYPNEPSADIKKAEACNKILEYVRQNQDFDDLCFRAGMLVQPHSCVGIKVIWDPLSGPRGQGYPVFDENGLPVFDELGQPRLEGIGEPLGDVRFSVVSIFDYFTDGSEDAADSNHVCFREVISKSEARRLMNMYGFHGDKIESQDHKNTWGVQKNGVLLREFWIRPGSFEFPDGLFAIMLGEKVLSVSKFPYEHGELPIAVWKCGSRRGSEYGTTHIDNAVHIQKVVNQCVSAIDTQAKQISSVKLLAHTSIIDKLEHGNQFIPVDDAQLAMNARWLEPPDRARVLVSSLGDNEKALFTVFGLNELLTGGGEMKSGTAAKAVAYLNKLDSMKMSGASRSLNRAILRLFKQTLRLYQQFVQAPRIAQILGKGNLYEALQFVGADIAGVDVRLEPISGFSQFRASVAEEAQSQLAAGMVTPELQSQAQTGLRQNSFDKSQRDMIGAQIDAVIKGEPQQADATLDPGIAVDEILNVISAYWGTPIGQSLMMLLTEYRNQLQSQQAQMQQMQMPQGGQQQ